MVALFTAATFDAATLFFTCPPATAVAVNAATISAGPTTTTAAAVVITAALLSVHLIACTRTVIAHGFPAVVPFLLAGAP
jgi:hypothetical protein